MSLDAFIEKIRNGQPVEFADTMAMIADHYDYQPTGFNNGLGEDRVVNQAGTNEGSCKTLAFAKLNQLDQQQTLALFGEHYQGVLAEPEGTSHPNIRNFIKHGWDGVVFEGGALQEKASG